MNVLSVTGVVGKDCEVRFTANGDAVASFSLAITSGFGERQVTSWLSCSIWGKRGETLAPMLLKSTKIAATGELTNRPYTAKDGTEKHSLDLRVNDVTLLGGKPTGATSDKPMQDKQAPASAGGSFDDFDDDILF